MVAMSLASEAATVYRAINDRLGLSCALSNSAAYLVAMRRFSAARAHAHEALVIVRGLETFAAAAAVQHLAAIAALWPRVLGSDRCESQGRAARLLGFVDARYSELQLVREYTEQQEYDSMLAALRDELGFTRLTQLMDEGRTWNENQAVAEALLV